MLTVILAIRFSLRFSHFKGFFSLGWIHVRVAIEKAPVSHAAQIRAEVAKSGYVLDSTKRRSLQPANQKVIPKGWTDPSIEADATKRRVATVIAPITPPLEQTFIHDFFGSQLVIGEMRIGGNLTRKKHRLEITHDQLLIDNMPQVVNQGELEVIKALIRSARS